MKSCARICSISCAWIATPGTSPPSGVARESIRPAADAPTRMIAPSIRGLTSASFIGIENVFHRHVTLRPVGAEIDPGLAIACQRQLERADAHIDQRRVAGVAVAARSGPADNDAFLVLRDAQRLNRKAGVDARAVGKQHRDAADDAGAILRTQIDAADTSGRFIEYRQARNRAVKRRKHLCRLDADKGQSRPGPAGACR